VPGKPSPLEPAQSYLNRITAAITQFEAAVDLLKEVIRPEILVWRLSRRTLIPEVNHKPAMDLMVELRYDDEGYLSHALEVNRSWPKALDDARSITGSLAVKAAKEVAPSATQGLTQ
jgi:hypothetical protein